MIGTDTTRGQHEDCDVREVRFTGRPSVPMAAVAFTVTAAALLLLTTGVGLIALPGAATGAELSIFAALSSAPPWVVSGASVVSTLADRGVSVVAAVVLVGALWWRTRRLELPVVAAALLGGSALLMFAGKVLVDRPRPEGAAATATFAAFPSGHAIRGMVFGLLLAWLLVRWRRSVWRYAAATGLMVLAIGIGLSRVILGVHWPADVVGGWLLGAAWFAGIMLILRPRCVRSRRPGGPRP